MRVHRTCGEPEEIKQKYSPEKDYHTFSRAGKSGLHAGECPSFFPLPRTTPHSRGALVHGAGAPPRPTFVNKYSEGPDHMAWGNYTSGEPRPRTRVFARADAPRRRPRDSLPEGGALPGTLPGAPAPGAWSASAGVRCPPPPAPGTRRQPRHPRTCQSSPAPELLSVHSPPAHRAPALRCCAAGPPGSAGQFTPQGTMVIDSGGHYYASKDMHASRAVQSHTHGGRFDFVWLSARTPHVGNRYVW